MRTHFILPVLLALLPSAVFAESEIESPVLGSGGGSVATATHSLHYTIGQPWVGTVVTTLHQLDAGFWSSEPTATAIDPNTPSLFPRMDYLHPNVPNPFNPATTIRYELATGGHIQLSVYDLAGHLVTRLLDGRQSAGPHSLTWRGTTSEGTPVASGVYLFVLDTPHAHFTQKSVLLK